MAASIHGVVRASVDADVVLSLAINRATALESVLRRAGLATELRHGGDDDPIPAMLIATDQFSNRVDLLIGLRRLDCAAFGRAINVPFNGTSLRVIGREDFIAMKVFAGGPVDLIDARRAVDGASGELDLALLRRLAQGFGGSALEALEKLL